MLKLLPNTSIMLEHIRFKTSVIAEMTITFTVIKCMYMYMHIHM